MIKRARVGIIGLDPLSRGMQFAREVQELGHTVVGGADVQPELRHEFEEEFDQSTYETGMELIKDDVDAIVAAGPNRFREPLAVSALEHDCYVFVDKPMAMDLAGAKRMVDAEKESNGFGMIGYNNRFCSSTHCFKSYQEMGYFGEITHVDGAFVRRRGIPGVGSWYCNRDLSGGGAIMDIGVHLVDLTLHTLSFPAISEVSATTRTNFGNKQDYIDPENRAKGWKSMAEIFDVEDSASAFIRTVDNVTVFLNIAWATNRTDSRQLVIEGTKAGAEYAIGTDELLIRSTEAMGSNSYSDMTITGTLDFSGYKGALKIFLDSAMEGTPVKTCTFTKGLKTQRVIDAIYRSSRQNRTIHLG